MINDCAAVKYDRAIKKKLKGLGLFASITPGIDTMGPNKAVAPERYTLRHGLPRASPMHYTVNRARGLLSP